MRTRAGAGNGNDNGLGLGWEGAILAMALTSDMGTQVKWMMALRVIIVTSLFLPTALLVYEDLTGGVAVPAFGIDLSFLVWFMGLTYGLTILYALLFRRVRNMGAFALKQIGVDVLLETGIVYYTGTVTTPFLVLYLVSIMAASILLERRRALGVASLAVLAYLTLLNLVYWGFLPLRSTLYSDVASIPVREPLYYIFVTLTGFLATSLLVNYLAERMRRAREELEEVGLELTELQRFNERVIDSISGGLMVVTTEGRISFLNVPGAAITGHSMPEIKGQPIADLFAGGEPLLSEARRVLARRKVFRFEDTLRARDGRTIPVGGSLTPLPGTGEHGESSVVGYVLIFQDLTELKKLEAEVRLKERLAAVGELAAGIAHEIRNPLASMSGSVQLLKGELSLTGDQRRLMDILIDESRRLSRIIQDFLTFARPPEPRFETVDLQEVLDQTLTLLRHSDELRPGHELIVEHGPSPSLVMADAGQIKQVCWNLALNALVSMPSGGRLDIRIDGSSPDKVRIVFRDSGVGIPPERMGSLFAPFSAGSPSRSGLGLSIVYGILREHRGTIDVQSEVGRGTVMTIELPRKVASEVPAEGALR